MGRFENKMLDLGYKLDTNESESGEKLVYKKRTHLATLVLIFHLDHKTINPILIADTLIVGKRDLERLMTDFISMREDAKLIAKLSGNTFKVLGKE